MVMCKHTQIGLSLPMRGQNSKTLASAQTHVSASFFITDASSVYRRAKNHLVFVTQTWFCDGHLNTHPRLKQKKTQTA